VLSGLFDAEPTKEAEGLPQAKYGMHTHQAEMLKRGISAGNPSVVTSGTGSGKTEAFLLPVFAKLASEGINWEPPDQNFLSERWWQDSNGQPLPSYTALPNRPLASNPTGSPFAAQRKGERRPAAVRALVLYPMNALVEDQLARLRHALDSDQARSCMDRFFRGNRIFLGKYTSATPTTGYHYDPAPRDDEHKRRERKLKKLFKAVCQMQRTQDAARDHDDPEATFLFPSVDGNEMTSRWDMQEHPPDVLITNTSMLNAMLAREVDSPIFRKTREWLRSREDSYFFLILDELHLQRGSAGTEVSFLLRLLIERLGLDDPRHRHKLRILASSASLPLEGQAGEISLQYLWDFFGSNGTWNEPNQTAKRSKEDWRNCILPGKAVRLALPDGILKPEYFADFLAAHQRPGDSLAYPVDPTASETPWRNLCTHLAPKLAHASLANVVKACIEVASLHLEKACLHHKTGDRSATPTDVVCDRLFGKQSELESRALRGILLLRGLGDLYRTWFPGAPIIEATSFRIHFFFRSIEGLFAPALLGDTSKRGNQIIGPLTVERGLRFSNVGGRQQRLLELIYCECCGELFFAGMKGGRIGSSLLELLPVDPDLDGLPDSASSQLFEDLTAETFGVFWPKSDVQPMPAGQNVGDWRRASLDPITGMVRLANNRMDPWQDETQMHGYFYERREVRDRHRRTSTDPGSCVPYACPSCGISYEFRKKGYRLSPIRNFRTGFSKTTQLFVTEIFELLHKVTNNPKLVSFSDSRQDAAKAALDIERRHHEDLARQILIDTINETIRSRPGREELRSAYEKNKAETIKATENDDPRLDDLQAEGKRLRALLKAADDPHDSYLADSRNSRQPRVSGAATRQVSTEAVPASLRPAWCASSG
jgi:hypothetical protein